jgi:hypothetical protein
MKWLLLALSACGDDDAVVRDAGRDSSAPDASADAAIDAGPPRDWPAGDVPLSIVPEPGVRRDTLDIDGFAPPANPVSGESTPPALDRTRVLRYRRDVEPRAPAVAVIIAMPGFLGGGGSFDGLARSLVRGFAEEGDAVEVWAIDRRSNYLEDLRGENAAEAANDPAIAEGYYFGGETIGGEAFAGFTPAAELSFASEWGLATHVEDLHRVIATIAAEDRRGHVFLVGHSLGASFTEAYASWRFEDGSRGAEELAGLVLIDGALQSTAIDETAYHEGTGSGILPIIGLDALRAGQPITTLPLLGQAVYAQAAVLSLRALVAPEEVVVDRMRANTLGLLLGLAPVDVPPMTNLAALGFAFDSEFQSLSFVTVTMGTAAGGPLEEYESAIAMRTLLHPSDPAATYSWIDADASTPPEVTPARNVIHAWVDGHSNFAEWYFPGRLALDLRAVGGLDVPEDDYRAAEGLRTFDRELVDAPVLAIAAGLLGPTGYDDLESRMAPEVGEGRPHAGATRAEPTGLRVVDLSVLSHIDPVTGEPSETNTTAEEIEAFVRAHAEPGTIATP